MSRRWMVGWLAAFLGFPLGGAAATLLLGTVDTLIEGLVGGLVAGVVIGATQMLALRLTLPVNWRWIAASAVGLSAGVGLSIVVIGGETTLEAFMLRAPITGFALGSAQWWILQQHVRRAVWWIPVVTIVYTIAWFVTAQVIGASLQTGFVVFGASGALLYQFLTGGLLWLLSTDRREQPAR
jgi:hypothetical protein